MASKVIFGTIVSRFSVYCIIHNRKFKTVFFLSNLIRFLCVIITSLAQSRCGIHLVLADGNAFKNPFFLKTFEDCNKFIHRCNDSREDTMKEAYWYAMDHGNICHACGDRRR